MRPRTPDPIEALSYMLDCTLATAEGMAMRKNPSKTQLWRQLNIASVGIEALEAETDPPHVFASRAAEVNTLWKDLPLAQALQKWAQDIHSRNHEGSSWELGSTHSRIV